jgi:hypothetical protein
MKTWNTCSASARRGTALIAALMIISMLAMLGLSMLSTGLSGVRSVNGQGDDYRLQSAVESVGTLAAENLWSAYLRQQGGAAGTIDTFRNFLTASGIPNAGPGGAPGANEGVDWLHPTNIPDDGHHHPEFDDVNVDALRVLRRDQGEASRLYMTVSASTNRGHGLVTHAQNRAIQLVYTVEPAPFEGFDYGILTNNVNCIFCHSKVDTTDRIFNHDSTLYNTFAKCKVGTLESLMLRNDDRPTIGDFDADTLIAGTLYVRGSATDQAGIPVNNWPSHSAMSCLFDSNGHLIQDDFGNITLNHFHPAGDPPQPGENLYLNYPTDYAAMPDGKLPPNFPPPFPDDGGIDPNTGLPNTTGANNQKVDPDEFYAVAMNADGTVSSGSINVSAPGQTLSAHAYDQAINHGNTGTLQSSTVGNVVLTGTLASPLVINGTVAINGDVVISGYVKGSGSIVASGNVYVPSDLVYFDGHSYQNGDSPGNPTGPITYGIAPDGTQNVLGLACGGNVLIGDYLKPSLSTNPGPTTIVTGNPDGPWNFTLAEISLFNRGEWAHTQPKLPGPGENHNDPSTWTVNNPTYLGPNYVPRYYHFGPGDVVPIYNMGDLYFDPTTQTWRGSADVPVSWDMNLLTIADPNNASDPVLYKNGQPIAVVDQVTPTNGWVSDSAQKFELENFKSAHAQGTPLQLDGLLYTNNAIFGIAPRGDPVYKGQISVNGALVCADLGMLAPGYLHPGGADNMPGSPYSPGLRLNYDKRTKSMLNVKNPNQVVIKRTLWRPTANML